MLDTAIIGGGLNGLALANLLHSAGRDFALFDARDRLGGRILSTAEGIDLGPTWYWPAHQPRITRLIADLGLESMPQWEEGLHLLQHDPDGKPAIFEQTDVHGGARRLRGGMQSLVKALAARLPAARLHLSHSLSALRDRGEHIELHLREAAGERILSARNVVLAMPPRLSEERIALEPTLKPQLQASLRNCPTWMAAQAKFVARYPEAFWRRQGHSGTATAHHPRAVLAETWDACDGHGDATLCSFVALSPLQRDAFRGGLDLLAASHLGQLFGTSARDGRLLHHDWSLDRLTCSVLDRTPSRTHPHYADPELRAPTWAGKLHFGGSESAAYGGGYLEGALEAAGRLYRELSSTPRAFALRQ